MSFDETVAFLRDGIRAYNEVTGVENTASSGYHETLTVAWAHLVHDAITRSGTREAPTAPVANPCSILLRFSMIDLSTR